MDYSGLVTSIQNGDERTTGRLCAEAAPILKKYLIKKVGASSPDADDAIQKMFEYIITKIKADEIENPSGLLSYMLTTCRHNYLKMIRNRQREGTEEIKTYPTMQANQIWNLVNEEEQKILQYCLEHLREGYKEFISYWFRFPNATTDDVAEHFDISINNAWIRKHRVVSKLSDCVETKT